MIANERRKGVVIAIAFMLFLSGKPMWLPFAFRHLGIQSALEGKWERAYYFLSRAEKSVKDNTFLFYLAEACLATQRRCGKRVAFRLYKKEKSPRALLLYAETLPEKDKKKVLAKGIQEGVVSLSILLELAQLEENKKEKERLLRRAERAYSKEPEVFYLLGRLKEEEGRKEEARAFYLLALRENPLHVGAAEGWKRVSRKGALPPITF